MTLQDFDDRVVPRVQNVDGGVNGKEDEVAPSAKLYSSLARVSRCGEAGPQILSGEGVPHSKFSIFPVGDNVETVGGECEAVDVSVVGSTVRFWRPIPPLDTTVKMQVSIDKFPKGKKFQILTCNRGI